MGPNFCTLHTDPHVDARELWVIAGWAPRGTVFRSSNHGRMQLWNPQDDTNRHFSVSDGEPLTHLAAYSSTSLSLVLVPASKPTEVWLVTLPNQPQLGAACLGLLLGVASAPITCLRMHSSTHVAIGSRDGMVRCWELCTAQMQLDTPAHEGTVIGEHTHTASIPIETII